MSKRIGQTLFVTLMWIYAFVYYLEVRALDDPSEKMTIVAVFWIFSLFAALEIFIVLKRLAVDMRPETRWASVSVRHLMGDLRLRLLTSIVLYLVLIPRLGFYTASALAFIAFSVILGTRSPLRIVLTGGLVLTIIYAIFSYSLRLTLPLGILI